MSFVAGNPAFAQISPGELAKVHSHLEGMSNCTKCHILGKKVSNQKCLDCHTELKNQVLLKKGYHSSAETRDKECVTCHSDHHGLNFQIIRFAREKFNHSLTGYNLSVPHAKKQCIDCHKAEFIKDPNIRKKKFTYLGLNTSCLSCHADYHQQTLPATCTDCHLPDAFKPASKFSHTRAKFQLSGKHQDVPCISCHKSSVKNGLKYQEFKGIKYDNCLSCHKDVHNGKFGQNCTQCHTEQSFSLIKGTQNFDHDKTGFKLLGKHQKVACNSCHKSKLTNALKFARCSDCHTDYHKNQFVKQGISPDCSQCHNVNGFKDFTFTFEQHNNGPFPLKGAHLAIPCFACHIKGSGKNDTVWSFREIGKHCIDCHKNIHEGIISAKFYPEENCENCHNDSRWNSINFDHQKTRFELAGAHAKKSCRDCHFKKDDTGATHQQFRDLPANCSDCHPDVHAKQFENNGITDCSHCHEPASFKPASKFDHGKTLFPLDGRHKDVACAKCHKPIQDKGIAYVYYKIKEFKCENCHH